MTTKLNICRIIGDHLATLHEYKRPKISKGDIFVFFIVPAVIAALITLVLGKTLTRESINFLATVFSIFTGLLLNLLVLIYDGARKIEEKAEKNSSDSARLQTFEETFANISYSILISVITLIALFCARLVIAFNGNAFCDIALHTISLATFCLTGNFLLTLLMILKRVHALLSR
ncbi:MAG: hypothetical protein QM691_08490 [Opitutaceae bacterium]